MAGLGAPRHLVHVLVTIVALLPAGQVRAETDPVQQARALVDKGRVQYRLGNFDKALHEFRAALKLVNRPSVILNVAQCYRQLKQDDKALFYYKLYLTESERQSPGAKPPFLDEVKAHIQRLSTVARPARSRAPAYRLRIRGAPVGAAVSIRGATDKAPGGGEFKGWLPFELAQLKFGSYEVQVSHPGHRPHRKWIWVSPDKPLEVKVSLERLAPKLRTAKDGTVMTLVPAGEFLRGTREGAGGEDDERPQRKVHLDDFYIDVHKVSVARYRRCVAAGACTAPATKRGCTWSREGKEQHPVTCVSWSQARAFCRWAGKRLPTEAEWEKAARGMDGRTYPWGNAPPTCARARFKRCGGQTVAVEALASAASPCRAVQMVGNVWEWVRDWYAKDYYGRSPRQNPTGPASGEHRACRGGSWFNGPRHLRAANRYHYLPTDQNLIIGFRCARDP